MKVLVTGGTGLLGNNIVRKLLADQHDVRVAVRAKSSRKPLEGLDVEVAEVDFGDPDEIDAAVTGVDAVVHSAAFIWFGQSKLEESRAANVDLTENLAESCLNQHVRLVHVSTVDTLGVSDGKTPVDENGSSLPKVQSNYSQTKTEAEQVIHRYLKKGLDAIVVHPGLMLGPNDWKPSSAELIIEIAKRGRMFVCPTGGISIADVRDVAAGTVVATEKAETGQHYVLAGKNMPYRELCYLIADACGVSKPLGRTGPVAILGGLVVHAFNSLLGKESIINPTAMGLARQQHFYSSQKAVEELGYQNRPLDETIKDAVDWLRSENMLPSA